MPWPALFIGFRAVHISKPQASTYWGRGGGGKLSTPPLRHPAPRPGEAGRAGMRHQDLSDAIAFPCEVGKWEGEGMERRGKGPPRGPKGPKGPKRPKRSLTNASGREAGPLLPAIASPALAPTTSRPDGNDANFIHFKI